MKDGFFSATFSFPGFEGNRYEAAEAIADIEVQLITDGRTVWGQPSRSDPLRLTPDGWQQLADCALHLVVQARDAWERLGISADPL